MFYAGTAGTAVTAITPGIPGTRTYVPTGMPMSAVLPGQAYYPTMHSAPVAAPVAYPMTAAPMVYGHNSYASYPYGHGGYYHGQPTVILSSAPRGRRSRSRGHGGFLGYL